jgi:hypothetical protein
MNEIYLTKNQEMWEKAMKDLAKCYPQDEANIVNYLTILNKERNRLLRDDTHH